MSELRVYKPYRPDQIYGSAQPTSPGRCAVEVNHAIGRWTRMGQCQRAAKYDAVIGGEACKVCGQHRPDAVAAREAATAARHKKQDLKWQREAYRPGDYMEALRKIAAGDNDARTTAREALQKWGDYND